MSNTNILELPTLDDEALVDIVGGCGKPPCQPAPQCRPRHQCEPPPCGDIEIVIIVPVCV
jgi:hypothetical protein